MRHSQRGVTFIGWLFLLVPVAIVVYAGIRLTPIYLNYMRVAKSLDRLNEPGQGRWRPHHRAVAARIAGPQLRHREHRASDLKDIDIHREGEHWVAIADYEDDAPLFGDYRPGGALPQRGRPALSRHGACRAAERLVARDDSAMSPRELRLFETALTHRSAGSPNNERLELLGDAVLGLIVVQYLFERFETADEGSLSRLRAHVVSGASLAQLGAELGLGQWLVLGPGELKTGGDRRESILANALEALCGALYLDGGLPAARTVMLRALAPALRAARAALGAQGSEDAAAGAAAGAGLPLPRYRSVERRGRVACAGVSRNL